MGALLGGPNISPLLMGSGLTTWRKNQNPRTAPQQGTPAGILRTAPDRGNSVLGGSTMGN